MSHFQMTSEGRLYQATCPLCSEELSEQLLALLDFALQSRVIFEDSILRICRRILASYLIKHKTVEANFYGASIISLS